MSAFKLTVCTPDGNAFCGDATMLTLRGSEGDLAILKGHIPFVTTIKQGECKIVLPDESEQKYTTGSGLLSVGNDEVTVLVGTFQKITCGTQELQ